MAYRNQRGHRPDPFHRIGPATYPHHARAPRAARPAARPRAASGASTFTEAVQIVSGARRDRTRPDPKPSHFCRGVNEVPRVDAPPSHVDHVDTRQRSGRRHPEAFRECDALGRGRVRQLHRPIADQQQRHRGGDPIVVLRAEHAFEASAMYQWPQPGSDVERPLRPCHRRTRCPRPVIHIPLYPHCEPHTDSGIRWSAARLRAMGTRSTVSATRMGPFSRSGRRIGHSL
jgi:hypothetical protein